MGILLSSPITTKESEQGEDALIAYGTSTMQGWRTGMEDAHAHVLGFDKNSAFFAIFDGHGGFEVARYCSRHMPEELTKAPSYLKGDYPQALKEAYISVDRLMATAAGNKELGDIHKAGISGSEAREEGMMGGMKNGLKPDGVGCTAVSAFIKDGLLYCANSGDSRCVLSRAGQPVAMSTDHKPDLPDERRRILDAGGFVTNGRVNGNLNLSRAIGDQDYKRDKTLPPERQIITCVPDIKIEKINEETDEFVVLACDGIWDCMSNQQVVSFVRSRLFPTTPSSSSSSAEKATIDATSTTTTATTVPSTTTTTDANAPEAMEEDDATLIKASSLTELLRLICESVLDRCLAPSSAMGIGCDNMSMTIVLPQNTKFAKAVRARFANSQQPATTSPVVVQSASTHTMPAAATTAVSSDSSSEPVPMVTEAPVPPQQEQQKQQIPVAQQSTDAPLVPSPATVSPQPSN